MEWVEAAVMADDKHKIDRELNYHRRKWRQGDVNLNDFPNWTFRTNIERVIACRIVNGSTL